jgi:EAL domain-containing protein (putative c-di-GMP-specific phosphodiesterase class I)/GGDEF domain-containing protein
MFESNGTPGNGVRVVSRENPITQFVNGFQEATTAFLCRYTGEEPPSNMDQRIRQALEQSLLDPCDISVISCDRHTCICLATPFSREPFDPLHVHSLLDQMRRKLAAPEALEADPGDTEGLQIMPVAFVSSVGLLQENLEELSELLDMLVNRRLNVQFQAIVHLNSGQVFGYEALMRVPQSGVLRRPGALISAADRARLVSWVDIACQEICFTRASQTGIKAHLFLNMDAEGLDFVHETDRTLADRAAESHISPRQIVLELTERQTVEDFPRLVHYIEELRGQGFKIAIDDAGAGYSSLHTIAELRPDFVKIDRSLVRSIENSGTRRALLSTLNKYAMQIGAAMIAEGIETRDELSVVMEIGVTYGQGYLLSRPNDGFRSLRREIRDLLAEHVARRRLRLGTSPFPVGKAARIGLSFPPETPIETIANKFYKNPDIESVVILAEERIEGLVMRERLEQALAADPDCRSRPVSTLMDCQPLIVDSETSLEQVAKQVTYRRGMRFHHDVIVADNGIYAGVLPVRALLETITDLKVNRASHVHPVTGLPDRIAFEQEANLRLSQGQPTVLLYGDIRHFRAFTNVYGIAHSDEALLKAARALENALAQHPHSDQFLAQGDYDHFYLLLAPEQAETVCREIVRRFDQAARDVYTAEQSRQGYMETTDAHGQLRRYPIFCLRLGGVSNRRQPIHHFAQALDQIRRMLSRIQTTHGSAYLLE